MKKVCGSNCKDPENRSKKKCVCGGHYKKKVKTVRPNIKSTFHDGDAIRGLTIDKLILVDDAQDDN